MTRTQNGYDTSHEQRKNQKMQLLYSRKTKDREMFMEDLRDVRKITARETIKTVKNMVGPNWYQVLSETQREALDNLEHSIYQDAIERRPMQVSKVMIQVGLIPRPNNIDLLNCVYLGRDDPKEFLAQLFLMTFGHPMHAKRTSYTLNAKLMLSGILYLGYKDLIEMLRDRFRPNIEKKPPPQKQKTKVAPSISPYLEGITVPLWAPAHRKRLPPPAPLPNLDDLNEPYEEIPVAPKPPPPPPIPPPPKKRLARSYCDKQAGITRIQPTMPSTTTLYGGKLSARSFHRRMRVSKLFLPDGPKKYGIGIPLPKSVFRKKKPKAPSTGLWNAQYMVIGVSEVRGEYVLTLGNVSIIPPQGELIHGGLMCVQGQMYTIILGYRGPEPPPVPLPCDCLKRWQDPVMEYVKGAKCICGHGYDYGNEGAFTSADLPFFRKPTRHAPYEFNYDTIYELDEKQMCIKKEMTHIWDTDSILHVDAATNTDNKSVKKKKRGPEEPCLGDNPKPEDYLKCAFQHMRLRNVAARLPDIHIVPELVEWMRRRLHGPLTGPEKLQLIKDSNKYWQMFQTLYLRKNFGHVNPPKDARFNEATTWQFKQILAKQFKKFTEKYKVEFYRSHAYVNNLFWTSMYQAKIPDKKFREIYFSYLASRKEDVMLMHPYNHVEMADRARTMGLKRVVCRPAGADDVDPIK